MRVLLSACGSRGCVEQVVGIAVRSRGLGDSASVSSIVLGLSSVASTATLLPAGRACPQASPSINANTTPISPLSFTTIS